MVFKREKLSTARHHALEGVSQQNYTGCTFKFLEFSKDNENSQPQTQKVGLPLLIQVTGIELLCLKWTLDSRLASSFAMALCLNNFIA